MSSKSMVKSGGSRVRKAMSSNMESGPRAKRCHSAPPGCGLSPAVQARPAQRYSRLLHWAPTTVAISVAPSNNLHVRVNFINNANACCWGPSAVTVQVSTLSGDASQGFHAPNNDLADVQVNGPAPPAPPAPPAAPMPIIAEAAGPAAPRRQWCSPTQCS